MLIALGETVVVIGATLADRRSVDVAAFLAAFVGVVALWWVYFDRSAEAGARKVADSSDPGRLGRSAYHSLHPIMVAGIIVTAAADQRVLAQPAVTNDNATAWLILGGTALFVAGHAAFKATVWQTVPWTRLVAIGVLGLLAAAATSISGLALGVAATVVVVLLAASDRLLLGDRAPETAESRK